jgi:hypothetical protein
MSSPPHGDFVSSTSGFGSTSPFRGSPFIEEDNPFADLAPSRNTPPVSVIGTPSMPPPGTLSPRLTRKRLTFSHVWIWLVILSPFLSLHNHATKTTLNLHPTNHIKQQTILHINLPSSSHGISSWSIRHFKIRRLGSRIGSARTSWRNCPRNSRTSTTSSKR